MNNESIREHLTIQQVADYLSIKTSSLCSKIAEIPHYGIGCLRRDRGEGISMCPKSQGVSTMVLAGGDF